MAVAAALASAIPWGSFPTSVVKTKEIIFEKAKKVQNKMMEKAIIRGIASAAKAAYATSKSIANKSVVKVVYEITKQTANASVFLAKFNYEKALRKLNKARTLSPKLRPPTDIDSQSHSLLQPIITFTPKPQVLHP